MIASQSSSPAGQSSEPSRATVHVAWPMPLFHVEQLACVLDSHNKLSGHVQWDGRSPPLIEAEQIYALQGVSAMAWEVMRSADLADDAWSTPYVAAVAPQWHRHARAVRRASGHSVPGAGYGMTKPIYIRTTVAGERCSHVLEPAIRHDRPLVSIKIVDGRQGLAAATADRSQRHELSRATTTPRPPSVPTPFGWVRTRRHQPHG